MDLRQLRTFIHAAGTLNFTRTAEAFNYAQSSVTAQIQALEAELGVQLFERLGKRLKLSSAGERLLEYAQEILRLVDEAKRVVSAGEEPVGVLRIGSVESLCTYRLPPLLQAFRKRFPKVQLVLHPSACAELPRGLTEGRFDAAFCLDRTIRSPHLVSEPLRQEKLVVVAHPGHRLAERTQVAAQDLNSDEALLVTEAGCSYRALFEQAIQAAGVRPQTVLEFGSVEALKQCAMAGMGIALLPTMSVRAELDGGRLVALRWVPELGPLMTQLVYHKDKWLSPALRALIATARETLGTTL
ncbi:MAG TPA: LysR family transcriptional regulator [Limnochordia bacterium]